MKVLWFTNTLVPGQEQSETATLRRSGGWILALLEAVRKHAPELKLAIASTRPVPGLERYEVCGVDCFVVPMRNKRSATEDRKALGDCARLVADWAPDLVHVHGTERFFGLLSARRLISVPVTISIQGLIGPYSEWYHYFGNRSAGDLLRMHRWLEIAVMRGAIWEFLRFRKMACQELEILRGNRYFMGRTAWDRSHLLSVNPVADYSYVGEALREPFWKARWDLTRCQRHRIIFTNAGAVRKGTETLLEAADLLRASYADLEVAIIGTISPRGGYGRHVRRAMASRSAYVKALGSLNAEEMARALQQSHVFVSPSFIDNSPNAVCEAQLVGVPVVSSYTGGVPSLIQEGQTGLFFPPGDAPLLASRIREVFENDALALQLGECAHRLAFARHDPATIVRDLLTAYHRLIRSKA